jgi:hypothetical protein
MFMCSLNYTSDQRKRLEYVNPNLINQLTLNLQINENSESTRSWVSRNESRHKKHSSKRKGISDQLMGGWFTIFYEVEVSRLVAISTLVKKAPNRRS